MVGNLQWGNFSLVLVWAVPFIDKYFSFTTFQNMYTTWSPYDNTWPHFNTILMIPNTHRKCSVIENYKVENVWDYSGNYYDLKEVLI